MSRRAHPLSVALSRMFSPCDHAAAAPTPKPTHFQVYQNARGMEFTHNPAYMGADRNEADRVAAAVGGVVEVCDGSAAEYYARPTLRRIGGAP